MVNRVFDILPPEREDIPTREEVMDATVAIQSFVLNVFGCLDNLAWVWVHEKGVKDDDGKELPAKSVGLLSRKVQRTFSQQFRSYLEGRNDWLDHVKNFRDALAHRIPLYIPPYMVRREKLDELERLEREATEATRRLDFQEYDRLLAEQEKLGEFHPWMVHSISENSPTVAFHPQLITDFGTIDESRSQDARRARPMRWDDPDEPSPRPAEADLNLLVY